MADLLALAAAARPTSEADWGTDRQIDAQNAFFAECERVDPKAFDDASDFADWGLKATSDELIDEALRLLRQNGHLAAA